MLKKSIYAMVASPRSKHPSSVDVLSRPLYVSDIQSEFSEDVLVPLTGPLTEVSPLLFFPAGGMRGMEVASVPGGSYSNPFTYSSSHSSSSHNSQITSSADMPSGGKHGRGAPREHCRKTGFGFFATSQPSRNRISSNRVSKDLTLHYLSYYFVYCRTRRCCVCLLVERLCGWQHRVFQ